MKTERRTPKIGEKVRLTQEYKDKYEKVKNTFTDYAWNQGTVEVLSVENKENNDLYFVKVTPSTEYMTSNKKEEILGLKQGYLTVSGDIPLFEVVIDEEKILNAEYDDNVYCKCSNPEVVVNYADWIQFRMCKKCGKERM